ncbi:MAG: DUF3391 domain-containing protein [Rhodocyclaceae bacterium]|jgi:HD-GYP domain-containing protein (c-di-GMP phosphodiesterase class II)|nr:DUF3391 domain-containing protein [Rhodocyclaceae bacterium]
MSTDTPDNEDPGLLVDIERLQPGVYISLAEEWLDHPFLFNAFRIGNPRQIQTLRDMGLVQIRCFPSRSTAPLLPEPPAPPARPAPVAPSAEELAALEAKRHRVARIRHTRESLARFEKTYARTAGTVRKLMKQLHAAPAQAADMARDVVQETVSALLSSQDTVLHLIGQKQGDENAYFHALNVMIVSLMLGRAEGLDEQALFELGMGALFHDLGKLRIPDAILRKHGERSRVEEDFYRLHPQYGELIASDVAIFTPGMREIIRHHHERMDGKGYPDGIVASETSLSARIVAIANRYDNLCNAPEHGNLTPAEALAQMYGKEGRWWDKPLLQRFIKHLGVFPPGSVVQLSNGVVGLVVAVNQADLLKPSVLVYDESLPRSEANIVDLIDAEGVSVERAIRRDDLPEAVLEYLAPRHRVVYFYDRPGS